MRISIALTFLSFCTLVTAQNETFHQDSIRAQVPSICEKAALKNAHELALKFTNLEFNSIDRSISEWQDICGINEINSRSRIIQNIIKGVSADDIIREYINSDFHYVFKYRMEYSSYSDYEYLFEDYRTYFDFIPLRHPIDSALMLRCRELFKSKTLSPDESLILILFSGDVKNFERESKKTNYKKGYIPGFMAADKRIMADKEMGILLYGGMYTPLSESKVFGVNPTIGLGLTSPMKWKFFWEASIKFRIHINDENFDFIALGDTNNVNSDLGFFAGLFLGYKIYESEQFSLIPKFGIGLEYIGTGLEGYTDESEEPEYYNIETLHTSVGISLLKPIFRRNYIGLEVSYHYSPYNWEKNLVTKFDNSAYSVELIFRF